MVKNHADLAEFFWSLIKDLMKDKIKMNGNSSKNQDSSNGALLGTSSVSSAGAGGSEHRKTRDSDCCSVNFLKYVLHIFNVVFMVSRFKD